MKYILLFSVLGFFSQNTWEDFTSLDGKFSIRTPAPFTEKVDSVDTALGKMAYHTFFYQSEDEQADNLFYMVSYCDYPEGIIFADSTGLVEAFFQETMTAAAESVEGEILYSSDIQIDTNPGKLWRIDYLDGKAIIKTKAVLVGNRYYAIQTIATRQRNLNPLSEQFFDSFRLL